MPVYWLGLLLILVFAVQLRWFPAAGRDGLASLVLPAVALGAFSMARIARMTRSGMLEVLAQDYVRTARAAGLRAFVVTYKYALKNAAIPLVTVLALDVPELFAGALVTEQIFGWPGMGRLFWDAATRTIWTSTQIAVLDAAKGRPGATVLVTEPGGVVGDTGHLFPGVPRFAPNQEVVAFLYQAPGDRLRVVGLWQGIYGVSVDPATGERLARPAAGKPETVYQELRLLPPPGAAPATRRLGELLLQIRERAGSR